MGKKKPKEEGIKSLLVRMNPRLHQRAAIKAREMGISLNEFILLAVWGKAIEREMAALAERQEHAMKKGPRG